jgi:hypothetical protein
MVRVIISLMIFCGLLITQGCLAIAAGYAGYAISSSTDEASEKEAYARNIQTYNTYKLEKEKLNLDRQKAGLKAQPIMTFEEWKSAHNISTPTSEPGIGTKVKEKIMGAQKKENPKPEGGAASPPPSGG